MNMNKYLDVNPEVAAAIAAGKPVVALESTIISHGMPYPQNVETALNVEKIIRENGAVPATIAIIGGRLKAGLTAAEIEYFGKKGQAIAKASRRDIAVLCARGEDGATTVTTTMMIAHMAGIKIFATGGIGGVHRGAETTMDISADLEELAQTPVMVVCAGANYHDGRLGQLFQVGGDVHGGFRAPMHAADAAGGENLDARHVGDHHGGGDGGGAVLTPGAQDGDVPAGGLGNGLSLLAEVLDFRSRQTGLQPPADDGDGGGYRAVLPDDLLHVQSSLYVLGVGHTVGDDGGFQRYHRLARGNGGGDFGVDIQILVHVHMCHSFSFVSLECEV